MFPRITNVRYVKDYRLLINFSNMGSKPNWICMIGSLAEVVFSRLWKI